MDELFELIQEKLGKEVFTESVQEEFRKSVEVLVTEQVQEGIAAGVAAKVVELEEAARKDADNLKAELMENLDSYLAYATGEFFRENKVAIENEFKVKAAEELIETICAVLEDNHFQIDPAKNKSLETLGSKNKALEEKINAVTKANIDLKDEIFEFKKALRFKKLTEGMSKMKVDKILGLLEGLEFNDIKDFDAKVKIVIEKVGSARPQKQQKEHLDEKFEGEGKPADKNRKYDIDKYLN